ncbi:hypothetical protein EMCRGX_G034106 [Ephydatia muelleri]
MANLLLNTSAKIPAFGLGTWQSKPGEVGAAVEVALKAGYRHIDCAHIYGNEAEIGETLQKCFREGVVKREEVFVTSKLWNADHASEDVEPACKLTLKNLQLEYLDLYLVHSPSSLAKSTVQLTEDCMLGYDPARMAKTWKAMEGLVEKGLVKAIGISNFTITKTENLLKTAKIVPAVNQVECHPYFQQPKLKAYCDSKGIIFEVYAPLGSPSRVRKQDSDPDPLDDPVIKEISNKHSATVGQICIAFQLHRGLVVIPKSVNPDRIRENLKATEVKLDTEDLQRLKALDRNLRFFVGTFFVKKSVTIEGIWDVAADASFVLPSQKAAAWSVKMNTGVTIPAFGLGTWQSKPGEVGAAVEVALKAGYRHIDCAHIYGNEAEIGETLQKCFREGVVKREEVFVTSKLWSHDHSPEHVEPAYRLTLKNLQLEYLDLYLVHNPFAFRKASEKEWDDENKLGYDELRMSRTWQAMEGLVEKGLVKAIGISNFTITKTENLLKTAKIVPAVNQVECHPYFQQPKLKAYCDSKGVVFEAYSPLGSPASFEAGEVPNILEDLTLKDLAMKHHATIAQICIAFQLHRGLVVIPKSVNPDRIRENLKATEVKLDTEDLQRLKALDKNLRFLKFSWAVKEGPTHDEEIWNACSDESVVV